MAARNGVDRTSGPQSVERALALLVAMSEFKRPVSVTEIARRVGLHPATTHRLLRALVAAGFAAQDADTSRYGLGPTLLHIARVFGQNEGLPELARPIMERLTQETGETTGLVGRDGMNTLIMARVRSPHPLLVHHPVGTRGVLHGSAGGKILLAGMTDEDLERALAAPLPTFTPRTTTDPAILRAQIRAIREYGYAVVVDGVDEGVTTIAAPVVDVDQQVIAALSVTAPTSRVAADRLPFVIDRVRVASFHLSRALGATCLPPVTNAPSLDRQPAT